MMVGVMSRPKVADEMKKLEDREAKPGTLIIDCPLAVTHSNLEKDLSSLDDELKITIGVTVKTLNKSGADNYSDLINSMIQNPVLQPTDQTEEHRMNKFSKSSTDWFSDPNQSKRSEVKEWIKDLVSDSVILEDLRLGEPAYTKLVEQTGVRVRGLFSRIKEWFSSGASSERQPGRPDQSDFADNLESMSEVAGLTAKSKHEEEEVVKLTGLRFPDSSNPHFKVYNLLLKVWSHHEKDIQGTRSSHGIIGDFTCRTFAPRKSIISELKPATKQKAIEEADQLFA